MRHAYEITDSYRARGILDCLGRLHVTPLPHEAATHAGAIFTGPGEDAWPRFLWNFVIHARRGAAMRPTLETILRGTGKRPRALPTLASPAPDIVQIAPASRVSSMAP